jgi:hypothetical protein
VAVAQLLRLGHESARPSTPGVLGELHLIRRSAGAVQCSWCGFVGNSLLVAVAVSENCYCYSGWSSCCCAAAIGLGFLVATSASYSCYC